MLSPAMHRRRLVIKINFIIIVKYCYLVECDQICDQIRPLVKIDMILEDEAIFSMQLSYCPCPGNLFDLHT